MHPMLQQTHFGCLTFQGPGIHPTAGSPPTHWVTRTKLDITTQAYSHTGYAYTRGYEWEIYVC